MANTVYEIYGRLHMLGYLLFLVGCSGFHFLSFIVFIMLELNA